MEFSGRPKEVAAAQEKHPEVNQAAPLLGMNLGGEVSGEIVPFEVGLFVRGFTYDGVGRLIRTVSPWPSPELSGGEVRVERYFYDGVRRISEVVTDPMEGLALAMSSGGEGQAEAQQAYAAEPELEGESLPVSVQQGQEGGGGGGSQNSSSGNPQTPIGGVTLSREYIWGPGDAGLDELLVQFGVSREAAWPVHDAGGDMVALCDTGGAGGSARLAGEWTYDAYGNVVTAASHHAFAEPRLGHKGLFIERLDGGVIDPATGYEVPRLAEGATTLAFARNRHLHTAFGRWLQEDPKATGQSLLQHQAFHGAAITGLACKVDIEALYGDGMSLVAYVGGDPWNQCDSLGLEFSLVGLMFSATNEADLQVDWAQQVIDAGNDVADIGGEFLNRAGLDMYDDFDWASDWSRSDDDYSRTKSRYIPDVVGIESDDGPAMAVITHHILTRCNLKAFKGGFRWTREFIRLFRKHGLRGRAREILNSSANTMELVTAAEKKAHSGNGHSFKYHMWALDRCARAMAGKTGEEAYLALLAELSVIRDIIRRSPDVLKGAGLP
ncbi:MAG TPA: hypothetical protein VHN77_02725 [Phycisphaerales bacterium]|nr:hypothetical protein [Phycisphaerales bacterium]